MTLAPDPARLVARRRAKFNRICTCKCFGFASYAPPRPKVTIHRKHRRKVRAPIAAVLPSLFAAQRRRRGVAVEHLGARAAGPAGAGEPETGNELLSSRRAAAFVSAALVATRVIV